MSTARQALLYNPFDPAIRADPYPIYRRLREVEPVHRSPLGFWALSRYDDVVVAQRDARFARFSERALVLMRRAAQADATRPIGVIARRWLVLAEAAPHRRFRGALGHCFGAPALARWRARATQIADELLDALAARGDEPVDLVAEFTRPLPVAVVCAVLGLAPEDRDRCRSWSEAIGGIEEVGLDPGRVRRLAESVLECEVHLREALGRARRTGEPSMLADLAGDDEADDELIAHLTLALFGAAYETTVSFLGNAVLALLTHPDQLALLRDDPRLAAGAVEELLRYDTSVQYHSRWTLEDVELGGGTLPAGSRALLLIAAANRDPDRFAEPDRLHLARPGVHPASFGGGPHVCLGAGLARLEAQVALTRLVARFPGLRLRDHSPSWRAEPPQLRALESLPVSLHP